MAVIRESPGARDLRCKVAQPGRRAGQQHDQALPTRILGTKLPSAGAQPM